METVDYKKLTQVSRGQVPADLVLLNGSIVNVFSGEIVKGGVAVCGTRIAAVGDVLRCIGAETEVYDAEGLYLTPGMIDGHVHIESSMLNISRFAELALLHGTTSVMTDLHEVAVVGGLEVVRELLAEAERLPFKVYFVIPSHVPFSPGFETTGGVVGPNEVREALDYPRCVGLSEIVVTAALGGEERLWKSMDLTRQAGKLLHGHGPFTYGGDMAAFSALGIRTDHEAFNAEDGMERLRNGIHLQVRQGSAAEGIPDILPPLLDAKLDTRNVSVITDDILAEDLWKKGYQDHNIRLLQKHGADAMSAVQMVTINAAQAFRVDHEVGVLAPGLEADIVVVDDLEAFEIKSVFARGEHIVEDGSFVKELPAPIPSKRQVASINWQGPIKAADLAALAEAPGSGAKVRVNVLVTPQELPVPELEVRETDVRDGAAQPDPARDIALMAVAERHTGSGNLAACFVNGFGLKRGAIASSVAHDHHNLIALGTSFEDVAYALNRVAALKGGQVVVEDGQVLAEVPLPILGLMSDKAVDVVCEELRELTAAARSIGCEMRWPHMFLSFMSCSAGPGWSLTDKGLLDGHQQKFLPVVVEVL